MVFDISEEFMYEMPLPNEPQGAPVTRSHEDVALKELKEESARGAGVTTFSVSSRISRRLFGREEQLNQLLGHLERSASGARIALIHGASGVGKTSLVQEFGRRLQTMQHTEWRARVSHRDLNCADENEYRPKSNSDHIIDLVNDGATLHSPGTWIQRNVVFIFGKNDLFKRHIPYAALVQAFDPLGVMLCELQEHLDAKGGLDRLQMDFPICMNTGAGDQDAKKTGGGRKHQSLFEYMDDNDLNAILALLANKGRVLTQVIPSLRNLVDSSRPDRLTGESLYSSWSSSGFSSTDLGLQLSKRNIGFDDSPVYSKTSLGSWLALSRGSKDSVVFGESSSSFNLPSMMSLSPTPTEAMSVTSSSSDGSSFITERFILALSSFLKLFCTSNRRLVWSMDDLQWADPCSLRVIEAIASNQEICNLLVIVGYREEKTESITGPKFALTPELSAFLMCLPTKQLLDIHVDNLSLDTVSEWLANILDLPPHDDTFKDLAKAVYKKTDGKPYFVLQYLALLHRKNLLSYSVQLDMAEKRSWQWRMPEIVLLGTKSCTTDDTLMEQACVSSNELELAQDESLSDVISFRVGSMPPSVQRMVQVASCLGTLFDVELLRDLSEHCDSLLLLGFSVANKGIYGEDSQNGDECTDLEYDEGSDEASVFSLTLEQAIKEGIMEKTDDPRIYKFTHDSIQRTVRNRCAQVQQ
jgi:predicted ATPase